VVESGGLGGLELAAETFMACRSPAVEVTAVLVSDGPLAARLADHSVPTAVLGLPRRPSSRELAGAARRLNRLLRVRRPQAVVAFGVKAGLVAVPAGRAARVPTVWGKVDFAYDPWLARILSRLSSGVVTNSRAVAAHVPTSRLLGVVPPPVRLPRSFRVEEPRPPATIGSVGRLVPYKGHHHVLDAAALLTHRVADIRVVIAGGPAPEAPGYADELAARARRHGLEHRLELLGHVDDMASVLRRLTVAATATHLDASGFGREGFGLAVAEAGWAGLPVVAARGGGVGEAMRDGVTGLLVPPRDPQALADAIEHYLRDPDAARSAGAAGASFARERFDPERLSARLWAVAGAALRPSGRS
jgi:glycosyltransferase involved in cell wall biosynthesis